MTGKVVTIGSRGSDLALWQANHIKDLLESQSIGVRIEVIKTQGDRIQHLSFDKMEGKGFFTKELEEALLDRRIDLAVHSFKDLETNMHPGLRIGAVSDRANPADVLLVRSEVFDHSSQWGLSPNAVVGTSSARRRMLLSHFRADLDIRDLRGNVPTRIEKLKSGSYDAILLAKAGLDRLGLAPEGIELVELDPSEFTPAPAQGALACQIRADDDALLMALSYIHHPSTAQMVMAERQALNMIGGGCQLAFGAYCSKDGAAYVLQVMTAIGAGKKVKRIVVRDKNCDALAAKAMDALKKKVVPSRYS